MLLLIERLLNLGGIVAGVVVIALALATVLSNLFMGRMYDTMNFRSMNSNSKQKAASSKHH